MIDKIITGDLHLHDRFEFNLDRDISPILQEGLAVFNSIIDLHLKNVDSHLIFLGDLFELKDKIPNHILVLTKLTLERIRKGIFLQGNHDYALKEFPSIEIFKNDRIKYINRPTRIDDSYYIPFIRDYDEFLKWFKYASKQNVRYIFFHQELDGINYSTKTLKISKTQFGKYLRDEITYFGGHIHFPIRDENVIYVGQPYQTEFDEVFSKIFYTVSFEGKIRAMTLPYSKFVVLGFEYTNESLYPHSLKNHKGNYIKIKDTIPQEAWKSFDRKEFIEKCNKYGIKGVTFDITFTEKETKGIEKKQLDDPTIIKRFVKKSDTELDKPRLIKTGKELCS